MTMAKKVKDTVKISMKFDTILRQSKLAMWEKALAKRSVFIEASAKKILSLVGYKASIKHFPLLCVQRKYNNATRQSYQKIELLR